MSINGFDFPKVTLRQVFQSTGAGTVDELGVVCVGPVYQYSPGETALPALFDAGVSGKYSSSLPASEQLEATTADVDTADAHAYVQNGVWQYAVDAVDAADWVDSTGSGSAPDTLILGTLVHDGTELAEGDSVALYTTETAFELYTVSSIASNTATHTYSVQVSGSTALPTSIVKVGFCLTADAEVHLNAVEVAVSDTTPAHTQSISATKSDFTTKYAGHSSLTLLKAEANSIKIRYRVVNKEFVRAYGSVDSLSDVETTLGPVCANNPVALGCYFALAGGAGTVYFIGTAGGAKTRAAFLNALDYLDRYTNMYSVVPCLPDNEAEDVIKACAGAIQQASEDMESKVWRTLWYGISLTENESEAAAGTKVQTLIGKRYTNSYRAQCVWGDGLKFDGEDLAGCNFALAAAAAGMRAGQPCHRPLSNLSYSFFSLTEPNAFTMSNLKALGANGIWIIANNEDGAPTNLRQVTTAVANNLNEDEESIVANADNIAINMAQVGRELVGCSNISPDLLLALEATIRNRMDAKLVNSYGAYIGPQILAWELVRPPYQDPVNLDHVLADFSITPPRPFNQFHMTLVVL